MKNEPSPRSPGPMSPKPRVEKLLRAFLRRRRAIKRHLDRFVVVLDVQRGASAEAEEMQLIRVEAHELAPRPTRVHLTIWEDSEAWLCVMRPRVKRDGGWLFQEVLRGRVEILDPREIVELFEKTLSTAKMASGEDGLRSEILDLWKGRLA